MDLIACDIGNSRIKIYVYYAGQLQHKEVFHPGESTRMVETLRQYHQQCGPQKFGARTVPVVASSVNKKHCLIVEDALQEALDQKLLLIGEDFPLEMKVAIENPDQLGGDRLLTAYAAWNVVEGAVVIADFGTATTIDCVNDQGIFIGGVIMPGLGLAARSLHEFTDRLPAVDIIIPQDDQPYGVNTVSAIQKGVYYGAIGAMREMTERYATILGRWPQLVVTGGYGQMVAEKCDFVDSLAQDLCANGLYLAWERFRHQMENDLELEL